MSSEKTWNFPIKAAIFDNDTILSIWEATVLIHEQILGQKIDENLQKELICLTPKEICAKLLESFKIKYRLEDYWFEFEQQFKEKMNSIKVKPGAMQVLEKLKEMKIPTILCTEDRRTSFMTSSSSHSELYSLFDVVLTKEHFSVRKPDPNYYLTVSKQIGIETPENLLVFTSTDNGILSASASNFPIIVVPYISNAISTTKEGILNLNSLSEFDFSSYDWVPFEDCE